MMQVNYSISIRFANRAIIKHLMVVQDGLVKSLIGNDSRCYQWLTSLRETHLTCAKRVHTSALSIVFSQSLTSLPQLLFSLYQITLMP